MLNQLFVRGVQCSRPVVDQENYLFDLPIVKNLQKMIELRFEKNVTFFVGENGTGKSTLLEALAVCCGFNPEGGSRNFCFASNETHSCLSEYLTLVRGIKRPTDGFFLRAESFYNVASEVDRLDKILDPLLPSYGGKSLHQQSHGESFLALILNRFGGNGLYILDEPEAALSPSRQFALLAQIHELVKRNSQLIIATHSPILIAYPGADVFVLSEDQIQRTPYQETETFFLTKQFLNNPEKTLHYLFDDEPSPS